MPLVSVVMPVYNAAYYLDESIPSILGQSYKNLEFIIINDGSTDNSLNIINKYQLDDIRIILISRENRGLVSSLNEGIAISTGKYIVRMDADDISHSHRVETQVKFMETNPHIGVCGSWVEVFGNGSKQIGRYATEDRVLKAELLFSSPFAHPTVILRKEIIEKNNLSYNSNFPAAEDYEFWLRCSKVTKFANLPIVLLRYRLVSNSATHIADSEEASRQKILSKVYKQLLKNLNIFLDDYEDNLHFILTLNTRIAKKFCPPDDLTRYFNKLIAANRETNFYDQSALYSVLGKKWLWNLIYHARKNPSLIISSLQSKYFYHGIFSLLKSKVKYHT